MCQQPSMSPSPEILREVGKTGRKSPTHWLWGREGGAETSDYTHISTQIQVKRFLYEDCQHCRPFTLPTFNHVILEHSGQTRARHSP